jgi:hypothetical protein
MGTVADSNHKHIDIGLCTARDDELTGNRPSFYRRRYS